MNILLTISILLTIAGGVYSLMDSNQEIANKISTAKELTRAKDMVSIEALYSKTGEISKGSVNNIKLSSLATTDVSKIDKQKIDALQRAVRIAVVEKGIDTPDCDDLAETNQISLSDCEYIKDKKNSFASISNDGIEINNNKIANILENMSFFSNGVYSLENDVSNAKITLHDKRTMELKKRLIEKQKNALLEIENIIQNETDIGTLKKYGVKLLQGEKKAPILTLKALNSLAKRINKIDSAVITNEVINNISTVEEIIDKNVEPLYADKEDYIDSVTINNEKYRLMIEENFNIYKNFLNPN